MSAPAKDEHWTSKATASEHRRAARGPRSGASAEPSGKSKATASERTGPDGPPRAARGPRSGASAEPRISWTVGELADELGITTRTLRFYEAEGLITPARTGANRVYDHRDRARMRLILRGKRFGMSLAEIREIVEMYDGAASSERRQLEKLMGRLEEITADLKARQRDLAKTLAEVSDVAEQCRVRLSEL